MATVALLVTSMPLHASEMDDRIKSSAKKSYVFKTYLKADDIQIKSNDGIVILTGTVSEESHKSLAQDTLSALPGVKSVDNRLEVKVKSPAENSDALLRAKVKSVLSLHRNVDAGKTEVYVKDGIVTLRGEASSQAHKELTTEYVKDVGGVINVKNEMTVSNDSKYPYEIVIEKIDDVSITAQVKMSLLLHRSTSSRNTTVDTNGGVVTLSGTAMNAAEKDLVTKLVTDINGVKSVNNLMTVVE